MPQTRDIALEQLATSGDASPLSGTRVDSAHTLGDALAALPPLAEMPIDQAINDLVWVEGAVQVQSQAEQLAAHLRQRQQELDRREAQLNARLADFEKEVRDARLWLTQRNDELNEREARLEAREEAFRGQGSEAFRVQGSGFRTDNAEEQVNPPHIRSIGSAVADGAATAQPTDGQAILAPREAPPDITEPQAIPAAESDIGRPAEWETRSQQLEAREARLHAQLAKFEEDVRDIRLWLAARHIQPDDYEERLQELLRARDRLARRRAALEAFWQESSRRHQRALNLRLLAEELVAQLRVSLDVAELGEAVAAIRRRLSVRYQNAVPQLTDRRDELEWLKGDLAAEQEQLVKRHDELMVLMKGLGT